MLLTNVRPRSAFLLGIALPCFLLTIDAARSAAAEADGGGLRQRIREIGQQLTRQHQVPGAAVAVIRDSQVVWIEGIGLADVAAQRAVTADTVFNVGSVSKCVAAWGFMQQVENGKIDLDAPIETYLTRWRFPESDFDKDQVTLRRILSHTAGLSLHGYPGFVRKESLPTLEESLSGATNGAGDVRLIHRPSTEWKYSGGGYTVAQLMLEEQTGTTFSSYLKTNVLIPLGMTESNFGWTAAPNAATPYDENGSPIEPVRFTALAAAGLEASCRDLAQFAVASLHGMEERSATVLRPSTVRLMQTVVEPGSSQRSSGLGYQQMNLGGVTVVGHLGSNRGWEAAVLLRPDEGDGLVMLANGANGQKVLRPIFAQWAQSLSDAR